MSQYAAVPVLPTFEEDEFGSDFATGILSRELFLIVTSFVLARFGTKANVFSYINAIRAIFGKLNSSASFLCTALLCVVLWATHLAWTSLYEVYKGRIPWLTLLIISAVRTVTWISRMLAADQDMHNYPPQHSLGAEVPGGMPSIPSLVSIWWSYCEYPLLYLKFVANGIDLRTISSKELMTASTWATAALLAQKIIPKMFKSYVADRPPETEKQCRMVQVCDLQKKDDIPNIDTEEIFREFTK